MLCERPNRNEKMTRDQKFLKTIISKLDRGEIRRDCWLQRKPIQWDKKIRDQAIVSTIQGEDIDSIKICEELRENKTSQKWIVDGGNRIQAWRDYLNNVFALGMNIENYIVYYSTSKLDDEGNPIKDEDGYNIMEDVEFDLRGKRYKDLPKELQESYNNYKIIYVEHSNCTENRMGYHIRRYNNQKSMNKNQKSVTYMEQTAKWVKGITENNNFFKELPCFHGTAIKNGEVERVVIDAAMLIFFKDKWNTNAEKNALYVDTNGEKRQFDIIGDYFERLYVLIEDDEDLIDLFEKKDVLVWVALFEKFTKLNLEDYKFVDFLKAFNSGLSETKIDGESFSEITGNKSTKNKGIIFKKIDYLEELMMNFLSVNKEDVIEKFETTKEFDGYVSEFINSDIVSEIGTPIGNDVDRIPAQALMMVCGKTDFSDKAIQSFILSNEYNQENMDDVLLYLDEINEWSLELPEGASSFKAKLIPGLVGFAKYTYDNDTNSTVVEWLSKHVKEMTTENDAVSLCKNMKNNFTKYVESLEQSLMSA